jgi:hypothetical protein
VEVIIINNMAQKLFVKHVKNDMIKEEILNALNVELQHIPNMDLL